MPSDRASSSNNNTPAPERRIPDGAIAPELTSLEIPPELPIAAHADAIVEAIKDSRVLLVSGETGSGKTTQLGKLAYLAGCRKIGCTQPRRIAATALARRVAEECHVGLGEEIGYKVRFDNRCGKRTILKFMTDGILLAETAGDPMLRRYDCIIVDEAHERSLNIDFLLGYLKNLLRKRRDLKVIISSATLESEKIRNFFPGSKLLTVGGRLFPVENYFLAPESDEAELADEIVRAVKFLGDLDDSGDILVFLPGEREIRDAAKALREAVDSRTDVLPLFGRLSAVDQDKVFHPRSRRRIILATNVAETSLTIPRIGFVIDSGLARISRYIPSSRVQVLRTEFISQASARQRAGRCGRIREGVCVRLYRESDLAAAEPFTTAEIQRSSLAGVILRMAALKLPPIDKFEFIDPPGDRLVREGMRTLTDLELIEPGGRLTRDGWIAAELPLDPQMGKMLIEGAKRKVLDEMIVIAADLSIPDVRERPFEDPAKADAAHKFFNVENSDFLAILKLRANALQAMSGAPGNASGYGALRRFCKKNYLNFKRMREWFSLIDDLAELAEDNRWPLHLNFDWEKTPAEPLHVALLASLPRNLARYDAENSCYVDMNARKFQIFPGSGLARRKKPCPWIFFFTMMETTRLFGRVVAETAPEALEMAAPALLKTTYDNIAWDRAAGFVRARERKSCGVHTIVGGRRCHYGSVDPAAARQIFIADALAKGEIDPPVSPEADAYLERLQFLRKMELRSRQIDRFIDEDALREYFEAHLPPEVCSVATLRKAHIATVPDRILSAVENPEKLAEEYPDFVRWGGAKLALEYRFQPGEKEDGPTVLIPEDDLRVVPATAPGHLVPGLLREKIELLLRALPKEERRKLMPMADAVELFLDEYRAGKVLVEQEICDALSDFLAETYDIFAPASDFTDVPLPEFLRMKIVVLDAKNRRRAPVYTLPGAETDAGGSKLGGNLGQVRKFQRRGLTAFPDGPALPEEVVIRGNITAYPALTAEQDNHSAAVELFLKPDEARHAHEAGILALYLLDLGGLWKMLRRDVALSNEIKLSFFLDYPNYADDLVRLAVIAALGQDLWKIRSRSEYERCRETSRDHAAAQLDRLREMIRELYELSKKMRMFQDKLREGSAPEEALRRRMQWLFRPGFLRCREAVGEYRRYLKALVLRAERILTNPARDVEKGRLYSEYEEKIRLAAEVCGGLENNRALLDFYLLWEESQIAAFAPELRTNCKCTVEILAQAWKELRL
ncbi:MAG: ATP-dependent RNA helicase HrpA [Victivallaceae bacterium]|nr:ATP-dependent RNA helicase HrpA [Victivallaceae bacterium]